MFTEFKGRHQNRKNIEEPRSLSNPKRMIQRRTKSNESQHHEQSHFCIKSKAFHQVKMYHNAKENQESLEKVKPLWMREETKQKSTFRAGFYEK